MPIPEDYKNDVANAWCPGCTNFGVLAAVRQALATLGVEPHRAVIVSRNRSGGKTSALS
ncbi:MAG: hypothetical protein QME32_01070 [Endomicrobiia bacterium]|nr:hypothetical protein [Endomicrobiia bacterium]